MPHPSPVPVKKLTVSRWLRFGLLNCFSLRNKAIDILELAVDEDLDVFALTETWMKKDDGALCALFKEAGFNIVSHPRVGRGGGVALVTKKSTKTSKYCHNFKQFECLEVLLKEPTNTRIVVVYRPGTSGKFTEFLDELEDLFLKLAERKERCIVCGDFNIHVETNLDPQARKFNELLNLFGWKNIVTGPTHVKGGTLDLILTQDKNIVPLSDPIGTPFCSSKLDEINEEYIPNLFDGLPDGVEITEIESYPVPPAPDHYLVKCMAGIPLKRKEDEVMMKCRNFKVVEPEDLRELIRDSKLAETLPTDQEECVLLYNTTLQSITDEIAPEEDKKIKNPDQPQWIRTPACQNARRLRRGAERRWKRARLTKTNPKKLVPKYHCWKSTSKFASKVLKNARASFVSKKLERVKDDPKSTHRVVNSLLGKEKIPSTLPSKKEATPLATRFNEFFKAKVTKIYSVIEAEDVPTPTTLPAPITCTSSFTKFRPVTDEELARTIRDMNKKHCSLDPMPSSMINDALPELIPVLSRIVNDSLTKGLFPSVFKEAIIRPSFKGKDLDSEELNSYRPISNLSFVSKVVEKCASLQLIEYLEANKLLPTKQSAYRKYHSCETATLKIFNDILLLIDNKSKVILLLLDLSAAFDTVKHATLLDKLYTHYGIKQTALEWFKSYLSGRTSSVCIGDELSPSIEIEIGVPQGSILGPILFVMYTREIQDIAGIYGLQVHMYADDTQLYISFDPANENIIFEKVQDCLQHIKWWMKANYLKLNADKTEVVIINNKKDKSPNPTSILLQKSDTIPTEPSSEARNLGVWFDQTLSMSSHVSRVIQSCWSQLANLWRIRKGLSVQLKTQLVHQLVHSRLDFGNGLLVGLSSRDLQRLQKVQNSATRFIYGSKGRRGVTEMRRKLHFLPVEQRIDFKICLLVYKCIHGLAPEYLSDMITRRQPKEKEVRLDDDLTYLEKRHDITTQKAFSVCGPKVWNKLPKSLREVPSLENFKKMLKTHLFTIAYPDSDPVTKPRKTKAKVLNPSCP